MYTYCFKRIFDVVFSLLILLLALPVLTVIILLLAFTNRFNVFFMQDRPGLHQKSFRILKLKTMTDDRNSLGELLPDNQRITVLGRFIRKLSIDELPQLINVLKGDMSLVGPRPLLFKYIPLYTKEQLRRHELRPGITGWAQVNGRNRISWTEKLKHDVYYVEHVSFIFDVKILFLTLKKVLLREGINQTDERPMMPFDGTN